MSIYHLGVVMSIFAVDIGWKDVLQLIATIGSLVVAVWYLARQLGLIREDLEKLRGQMALLQQADVFSNKQITANAETVNSLKHAQAELEKAYAQQAATIKFQHERCHCLRGVPPPTVSQGG